jgi:hypothetical protein
MTTHIRRVGLPELSPSITLIGLLTWRPPRENHAARVWKPAWCAAIDAINRLNLSRGYPHPGDAPPGAEGVRHADKPLAIGRPIQLLEKTFAVQFAHYLTGRDVDE